MTPHFIDFVDSHRDWLGRVPAHWRLSPLGSHFTERNETVSDSDYAPLSVTKGGVVPQIETVAKTDNNNNRKLVRAGDLAINSRSDRRGSSGLAVTDGSVSVVYTILTPRETMDARFAHHLLRSTAFQEEFYRWGNGIVADLWSTRYSSMKSITLAVPPLDEQQAIAEYLDRETAQIDTLIGEQQRLIELVHERRKALVESAVADVDARGSRFKDYVTSVVQGWSPQCHSWSADGVKTWAVLKAGAANGGRFRPTENKELPDNVAPRPQTVVRAGQLVVSRANTRELLGSAAVVEGEYPKLMLCDKLYAFTLDERRALPRYVAFVFGTRRWRDLIELEATGSSPSMQNISQSDIMNLPMDLPSIETQFDVLRRLDENVAKADALIAETERFIELSRERRAALITAAVTGQIDVREKVGAGVA